MKITFTLILFSILLFAEQLETVIVTEQIEINNEININEKDIDLLKNGNDDISSVLSLNPSIRIQNKSNDIESMHSLKMNKIQIHKAKYYQNNFLLDGLSNNSLLDPASNDKYSISDTVGNENSLFIDLDLIEEINVYDSFIPAKYGNFNGGVIETITKRPKFETSGKIKYKFTSNNLSKFHLKENSSINEPTFYKKFLSLYHNQMINENSAFLIAYSSKKSQIQKDYFKDYKNERQKSQNLLLKYSYFYDNDSILDLTFLSNTFKDNLFRNNVKNSDFISESTAYNIKANYERTFDFYNLNFAIALKNENNNRIKSQTDYKNWLKLKSKNWGLIQNSKSYSYEGGYGDIYKKNNIIDTNLFIDFDKFKIKDTTNELSTGLSYSYANSNYKRKHDTFEYYSPIENSDIKCNGYLNDCIENEQYFSERKKYKKEDVSASVSSLGYFVQNNLQYKRLLLSTGLRFDYNNFLQNLDISPRITLAYDIFGNKKSTFLVGHNKYYGKSFLAFKLREAKSPYSNEYRSSYRNQLNYAGLPASYNATLWSKSAGKGSNKYKYSSLSTPYTNEFALALKQKINNNTLLLKYVKRDYKNQFKEEISGYKSFTNKNGTKAYYKIISVTNNAKNSNSSISLKIQNDNAIKLFQSDFYYIFSTSYNLENSSNFTDYNLDENTSSENKVFYKGKVIDSNNLPIQKEAQEAQLNLIIDNIKYKLFDINTKLTFINTLNYRDKYTGLKRLEGQRIKKDLKNKKDIKVYEYEDEKIPHHFTIDSKVNFSFALKKKQYIDFNIEVTNLLNTKNKQNYNQNHYSIGRQIWFELSYKY